MRRIFIAAVAFAWSAGAAAGDFRFEYEPTELVTAEGVQQVYDRLESEANRFCRQRFSVADLVGLRHCREVAIQGAMTKIGNPNLIAHGAAREATAT